MMGKASMSNFWTTGASASEGSMARMASTWSFTSMAARSASTSSSNSRITMERLSRLNEVSWFRLAMFETASSMGSVTWSPPLRGRPRVDGGHGHHRELHVGEEVRAELEEREAPSTTKTTMSIVARTGPLDRQAGEEAEHQSTTRARAPSERRRAPR
jgi:hypothetical protein